jgi:hypothetical protein
MRLLLISLFLVTLPLTSMPNVLTSHPFAVDDLYTADSSRDFSGTKENLKWNSRRGELALSDEDGKSSGSDGLKIYHGVYTSRPVKAPFEFHELIPSWNIRLDEKTQGYAVHLRVSRDGEEWSPWMYFGAAGVLANVSDEKRKHKDPVWGDVDIDYYQTTSPVRLVQYRVALESHAKHPPSGETGMGIQCFFLCYSNTGQDEALWNKRKPKALSGTDWQTTLTFPYRNQHWVPVEKLRGQICCPTCISMVLEGFGVNKPTLEVAWDAYDPERRIFGVWPRASQAAYANGMTAWVQRFRNDDQVKEMIAKGIPVMASIRAKRGELTGAGYQSTRGHLILIRGFTPDGNYIINDPNSQGAEGAEIVYKREDVGKIWFDKGGVGIVIFNPDMLRNNGKS